MVPTCHLLQRAPSAQPCIAPQGTTPFLRPWILQLWNLALLCLGYQTGLAVCKPQHVGNMQFTPFRAEFAWFIPAWTTPARAAALVCTVLPGDPIHKPHTLCVSTPWEATAAMTLAEIKSVSSNSSIFHAGWAAGLLRQGCASSHNHTLLKTITWSKKCLRVLQKKVSISCLMKKHRYS